MNKAFEITQQNRKILQSYLNNYTLEQLNKIPVGFNNNIFWNIAHTVVVQQLLVYKLSGLEPMITKELVSKYAKGTKPEKPVSQAEVDEIENLLFQTIDQTKTDYDNKIFNSYHEFKNDLGFTIKNVDEAITFNNFHEATHLGIILCIKKFV